MILERCKRRHFYDRDKFAECPYCALEKSGIEEETGEFSDSLEDTADGGEKQPFIG